MSWIRPLLHRSPCWGSEYRLLCKQLKETGNIVCVSHISALERERYEDKIKCIGVYLYLKENTFRIKRIRRQLYRQPTTVATSPVTFLMQNFNCFKITNTCNGFWTAVLELRLHSRCRWCFLFKTLEKTKMMLRRNTVIQISALIIKTYYVTYDIILLTFKCTTNMIIRHCVSMVTQRCLWTCIMLWNVM